MADLNSFHGERAKALAQYNNWLTMAAAVGDAKGIEKLLDAGANARYRLNTGETALHRAAMGGHADCVKRLLVGGANANDADNNGYTALMRAVDSGSIDTLLALLPWSDVNARNGHGRTALFRAAALGRLECLDILLGSGGDPNAISIEGQSALHAAATGGSLECAKRLAGLCDANARDALGRRAHDCAKMNGHARCADYLLSAIKARRESVEIAAAVDEAMEALTRREAGLADLPAPKAARRL